jgi:hypothetical protein
MKKVAVLVIGEFREFEIAHKSWEFLNHIDYDLFISTWDTSTEINQPLNININETVEKSQILKYFPDAYVNIKHNPEHISNVVRYAIHLRSLFNMMEISGNEYDIVMLIRPDLYLRENESFGEYINNISETNIIYGFSHAYQKKPPNFLHVNDVLFVGPASLMRNTFLSFRSSDITHHSVHYHLARHFIDNDVYVQPFSDIVDFFVMRSLHRKFLEYDFERLWSIGNHWFEVKHNKPITTSKDIIIIINEKMDLDKYYLLDKI